MKTKKFIIAIVCLFFTCQFATADDMKENTENWLQKSAGSGGTSRINPDVDPPTDAPAVADEPIPDSLPYVCLLAGAYVSFLLVRKKENGRA
ncbi:MAG: hypothetical protein LBO74_08085 [Candidatus Symbiothrix sp.]|jgi:hypothetical protein|nr:hypothetical protein [Candidatus Symbiothrix sp.]